MVYNYSLYINYGVLVPLLTACLLLAGAIILAIVLHKKKESVFITATPLIALLCAYMLLLIGMHQALPFLENIPLDKEVDTLCDIVCIVEIEQPVLLPIFYSKEQNNFTLAGVIKTNRGTFYCIDSSRLTPGGYYEIIFLPHSRSILDYDVVTESEAAYHWTKHPVAPSTPKAVGYQETGYEGQILAVMFFAITIKNLAITIFSDQLTGWLYKQDRHKDGTIRPRLFGALDKIYNALVILLTCIYAWWTKTTVLAVLILLMMLGYGYYIAEVFSTRITYSDDEILFHSFTSNIFLKRENVIALCWEYPRKSSIKALVIYLTGKRTITLRLIDYIGLHSFFQWWEERKARKTGGGLREP